MNIVPTTNSPSHRHSEVGHSPPVYPDRCAACGATTNLYIRHGYIGGHSYSHESLCIEPFRCAARREAIALRWRPFGLAIDQDQQLWDLALRLEAQLERQKGPQHVAARAVWLYSQLLSVLHQAHGTHEWWVIDRARVARRELVAHCHQALAQCEREAGRVIREDLPVGGTP